MNVKKLIVVAVAALGISAIAVPAIAEPIDACNTDNPDFHITVGTAAEACLRYPIGSQETPSP